MSIHHLIPVTKASFTEWHAAEYATGAVTTPAAVARYLGVNKATVWRWLDAGDLPGIRTARYWVLMTADIDAWIKATLDEQAARN